MKIRLLAVLLIVNSVFIVNKVFGQSDTLTITRTYHVGFFAPLYLDSVFTADGKFRYKQGMPKLIMPGVDFMNGVQIALDSLKAPHNVHAYIYDTKSYQKPVEQLIKNKELDSLHLIIGSVKDIEYKQLADFALAKNIPFISATYPNDGGITNNPFMVLLNSTLKAHCEAIFSFALQNHGTDKVLLIRKKGFQEDKIASYFETINKPDGKPLLDIQTVNVELITPAVLQKVLDSNRQAIIIGASLDEKFATELTSACYKLSENYGLTLVGMPNWDGFKTLLKKDEFTGFPIYFTTPYYNSKTDDYSRILMNGYGKKYKGKPSDMVFKGFESANLFINLLLAYPHGLLNHLNDKKYQVITDYNFLPVTITKGNPIPDYFENKRLYFIKILNGTTSRAW